jgi:hypothetical protein
MKPIAANIRYMIAGGNAMNSNQSESTTHANRVSKWISGIGPGLAIGTAIGLVTQNIWVGLSVGTAICITIIVMQSR